MAIVKIKMLRYLGLVILIVLFCAGFSNCHLNDRLRTLRSRIADEDSIKDTQLIRDAQKVHKQKFGDYGSIEKMVDKGLLASRLKDGEDSGYRFILTLEKDGYFLTVRPLSQYSEKYNLTMYVDDSGVIRISEDPQKEADSKSYPIDSQ